LLFFRPHTVAQFLLCTCGFQRLRGGGAVDFHQMLMRIWDISDEIFRNAFGAIYVSNFFPP
jgi:hypothetical protein